MNHETEATYPSATWRLLYNGSADGATNMAVDEAVLLAVAEGVAPPTLRFYMWEPPCLSIGYNQSMGEEVDLEACRARGVDWVRRPTGGRAILHTDELTYSVVAPQDEPRVAGGVVESYRRLSQGLLDGLRRLGAEAVQAQRAYDKQPELAAACFDTPSNYEITVGSRKLVGSAQVRRRGVVLQHGSLPLCGDLTRLFDYLRLESEQKRQALRRALRKRAATLEEVLGQAIPFDRVAEALSAGFAQALDLKLEPWRLTARERELAAEMRGERYATDEWNFRK
jgi:lipoate-protein ligase A